MIVDNLVEIRAPFNTTEATAQIVAMLKGYGLHSTMGDSHAKGWVIAELARHNFRFEDRPTAMDRSTLYAETLALFSSGKVRLLDNKRMITQYLSLERRLMPNGWSRIDHPDRSGYHDDLSNVTAGALWRASQKSKHPKITAADVADVCNRGASRAALGLFPRRTPEEICGERGWAMRNRSREY